MTKALKIRKTVLLALFVILLAVCIVQCVTGSRDNTKNFVIKEAVDELTITGPDGDILLVKENDSWVLNEQKYPANQSSVDSMLDSISEIKALDKTGKLSAENIEKYELKDGQKITVTAKGQGKVLRTVELGKSSSAGSQGFAVIDGGNDIYLVAGNLRSTFERTVDSLRSRTVLALDKASLNSVSVTAASGETWALSRSGEAENLVWNISGADVTLDAQKASDWLESLANLSTTGWLEKTNLPSGGEFERKLELAAGTKNISLEIYKVPAADEDSPETYYAFCSETPYPFTVAGYTVQKYLKNPEEIAR